MKYARLSAIQSMPYVLMTALAEHQDDP